MQIVDKTYSPIFVTGIERSGNSIVARILSLCGAFTGKTTIMSENLKLKNLVDFFYKSQGYDVRGQYPLPNLNNLSIPFIWKDKVLEILNREEYDPSKLWMYKSSRLSQIWPVWNYSFPDAKWLIVRRRSADVVYSCMNTDFMDAYSDKTIQQLIGVEGEREGWLWWIHQHEDRFVEMIQAGLNTKIIWPERLLNGDYRQIYDMLEWVGLKWKDDIIPLLNETLIKSRDGKSSSS